MRIGVGTTILTGFLVISSPLKAEDDIDFRFGVEPKALYEIFRVDPGKIEPPKIYGFREMEEDPRIDLVVNSKGEARRLFLKSLRGFIGPLEAKVRDATFSYNPGGTSEEDVFGLNYGRLGFKINGVDNFSGIGCNYNEAFCAELQGNSGGEFKGNLAIKTPEGQISFSLENKTRELEDAGKETEVVGRVRLTYEIPVVRGGIGRFLGW